VNAARAAPGAAAPEPDLPLGGCGAGLLLVRAQVGQTLFQVLVVVVDLGLEELALRRQRPQGVLKTEDFAAAASSYREYVIKYKEPKRLF
jgi:hypothetical protein